MFLRILIALASSLVLLGCEPKFSTVTFTGLPACPESRLTAEVMVKLDGPRVSVMERLDGRKDTMTAQLQRGKQYTVKGYFCRSEPCETPAQLLSESTVTAPDAETGSLPLGLKNLPDCVAVAPPEPAAEPDADAGAPAEAPVAPTP